jgi:hypothetical protein
VQAVAVVQALRVMDHEVAVDQEALAVEVQCRRVEPMVVVEVEMIMVTALVTVVVVRLGLFGALIEVSHQPTQQMYNNDGFKINLKGKINDNVK